jgi:hypothetical protein
LLPVCDSPNSSDTQTVQSEIKWSGTGQTADLQQLFVAVDKDFKIVVGA